MIQIDDFYINYKLIIERIIKTMIATSLDESKAYADSIVTTIFVDCGTWNASADTFPSSGGSGPGGSIRKGDTWTVIAPGSPDGLMLEIGDIIRAFVDNPGQVQSDWVWVENQYNYVPFNKEGDTVTGTNGSGFIGLIKQLTNPSVPLDGLKLFANDDGHLTFINENGEVKDIDNILDLLNDHINGLLLVNMSNNNKTLTAEESKNSCFILTNVGDGTKTLTLHDSVDNAVNPTFYVFDNNPVFLSACGGSFSKKIRAQSPLQIIYTPTQAHALNYVTFNNLMTPGWAMKVHFNEFGLIDNTTTVSTADIPDSLNKRYVTDAEKAAIDDFILAGGSYVPTSRTVNGHALTSNVVVTKSDVGLGNADNTSDLNKPISTATQTALNAKEDKSQKGIANGYVPLDNATKIASTYLPDYVLGALKFKGFWNASTNRIISSDPTLNNQPIPPAAPSNEGWYFIVQTEGSSVIDGNMDWQQRDWIVSIGTSWQELDNTDAVWSVNGHEGIVTLHTGDIPDEPGFRYVTDAEKTKLANLSGVNTGDQTLAGLGGVPISRTINGHALTANINITATDIGLGNVNNTADMDKPVSTFQQTALNAKQSTSAKGQANGYAPLDANGLVPSINLPHDSSKQDLSENGQPNGYPPLNNLGKIPSTYLPTGIGGGGTAGAIKFMGTWDADLNIVSSPDVSINGSGIPPADIDNEGWYFVVSNPGDTIVDGEDFWVEEDWIVSTGLTWIRVNNQSGVTSVNGRTGTNGAVVLTKSDIGLGNVNNTSDLNKPISTATQTALNAKEDKSQKGANNGYAPLDGTGKVPLVNLPSALANTLHQQFYEITPTDVLNKFITLEYIPTNPLKVDVVIYGGIHQRSNIDFLVTGNILSWNGLALESLIEANHFLNITYPH